MLLLFKRYYFRFIVPPLHNTITFNIKANLSRKEYIIFWFSIIAFSVCVMLFIIEGISLTRGLFRFIFDVEYPKWRLSNVLEFFMFGSIIGIVLFVVPFFISTANRLQDAEVSTYILFPLFILFWLWSANLLQFRYASQTSPLFYQILTVLLVGYFAVIVFIAIVLPSKKND